MLMCDGQSQQRDQGVPGITAVIADSQPAAALPTTGRTPLHPRPSRSTARHPATPAVHRPPAAMGRLAYLPNERARLTSAKHLWEATEAALARKTTLSVLRSCVYS